MGGSSGGNPLTSVSDSGKGLFKGLQTGVKGLKDESFKDLINPLESLPGGKADITGSGIKKQKIEEARLANEEEARRQKRIEDKREQEGTSALASAEEVAKGLASDPTAQVAGDVSELDPRFAQFSSLLKDIERRRSQILTRRRQPGRRGTILTR